MSAQPLSEADLVMTRGVLEMLNHIHPRFLEQRGAVRVLGTTHTQTHRARDKGAQVGTLFRWVESLNRSLDAARRGNQRAWLDAHTPPPVYPVVQLVMGGPRGDELPVCSWSLRDAVTGELVLQGVAGDMRSHVEETAA